MRRSFWATAVVALLLAGCASGERSIVPGEPVASSEPWPAALHGPFPLLEVRHVSVPSQDGVLLDGFVWLPELPPGVRAPVVLFSNPYTGHTARRGDDPQFLESDADHRFRDVLAAGYAVAVFNVRGTGESGGCMDLWGPKEQGDQVVLVNWAANQTWSNGRVAMYGISWMGATPWMAAIANPPALKTIIPAGIISDVYLLGFTPQGAAMNYAGLYAAAVATALGVGPPTPTLNPVEAWTTRYAGRLPARLCPEVAATVTSFARDGWSDDRNTTFWNERRLIDHFGNITAAVFVVQGLADNQGHAFQEDVVWPALPKAPRRMLLGPWGHTLAIDPFLNEYAGGPAWSSILIEWLDYWLKGIGSEAPRLGTVDYRGDDDPWRRSSAWPPTEAREEVLYLSAKGLATDPSIQGVAFRAAPGALPAVCSPPVGPQISAWFESAPLKAPVTVAGNPFALLQLRSDAAAGVFTLDLVDLPPTARCDDPAQAGFRWLSRAAVDLRFHDGNLRARNFPTDRGVTVRADFVNMEATVPAGHVLAIVAAGIDSNLGAWGSAGRTDSPLLTFGATGDAQSSHIVLPLVEGTLEAHAPTVEYPPRPFSPRGP